MIAEQETCVGCGAPTNGYEYVGVGEGPDAPANQHGFKAEAFPVCKACHTEPKRPMKLHYFHRSQVGKALQRAGSPTLG
ncbi:MAG: hypothetical protein ABI634_02700 [Acidobacteriota bacterium]